MVSERGGDDEEGPGLVHVPHGVHLPEAPVRGGVGVVAGMVNLRERENKKKVKMDINIYYWKECRFNVHLHNG